LSPAFFSKICGTTGLVVFFIKDILDYWGITNEKKYLSKAFLVYNDIIKCLNLKIEKIRNVIKKF
jgi:hypothetical protein